MIEQIKEANPTTTHKFCKFLYDNNWLVRVYTQNIDYLHQKAGLPDDMVVEYHGSVFNNKNGSDSNIVLYNDQISSKVISQTVYDFVNNQEPIDLLLVMGTTLQVAPFCALPNLVPKSCTRILIDNCPENAFTNIWTKKKYEIDGLYIKYEMSSLTMKFGKRLISLRPQWDRCSKWKRQHIITSDTDEWVNSLMSH
jgi:NAD-dependent SIR2 family protein deacetylase